MNNPLDTMLLFGFLTFLHLWGGAAIGAGLHPANPGGGAGGGRHTPVALPMLWGLLVGVAPMYFGLERGIKLDSWAGLAWQVSCVLASAIAVAAGPARLRAWLLQDGMIAVMIGSLVMAAGAILGAVLFWRGAEVLSLILGGAGFIFGAMWFGSGLSRLRGKS
jgi:hypothetical protein